MSSTDLERRNSSLEALSVDDVKAQVQLIQHLMAEALIKDEHYGVIPGTGTKPTLLKPGAEKLCFMFRLDPEYPEEKLREVWAPDGHYTVTATCVLFHIDSGKRIASGLGLCSSKEEKYAFRRAEHLCPDCQQPSVVRSVKKSSYYCIKDKGGCGHRFPFESDKAVELDGQEVGRKPNPSLPDSYNTVLKMACKRALIAAVLNGTAASDIFTQDLDDSDEPSPGADSASGAAPPGRGASDGTESVPEGGSGTGSPGGPEETQAAAPSGPDLLMTFGQYKATRVGDLPHDYLRWLAGATVDDPNPEREPFVPEDEHGGQLQEAAKAVLEGIDREARRLAIGTLSSAFKHAEEHGSLPPGHDDWEAYLKWYIEGAYKVDVSTWRAELTPQQIQEVAAKLQDMDIPL